MSRAKTPKPATIKHWSERMNEMRTKKGWGWRELARRSDVPFEALYKWKGGKIENPEPERINKVADALGVSTFWLLHGIDLNQNSFSMYDQGLRRIPLLSVLDIEKMLNRQGWTGPTIAAPDDVGPEAFGIKVPDNALQNDGISANDILVIDPGAPPTPGKPVAAIVGTPQRAVIRKFRQTVPGTTEGAELLATHPDYPLETIKRRRGDVIVGAATHHIRRL